MMKFGLVLLAAAGASAEMGDPTSYTEMCKDEPYEEYVMKEVKEWAQEQEEEGTRERWNDWKPFDKTKNETQWAHNEKFLAWGDFACAACGIRHIEEGQPGNDRVYPEFGGTQGVKWYKRKDDTDTTPNTDNDLEEPTKCEDPQGCAKLLINYRVDGFTCNPDLQKKTMNLIHNKCYFRWRNSHTKAVMNWIDNNVDACTSLDWTWVAAIIGIAIFGSVFLLITLACCIQTFKKPKTQEKLE